ncbi:NF038129 family PEP-CTERM protein [Chitinivorax sp. B]|uniref:NF038129 family PEP-CTERM protein n=1 Tax=Chitinivorax sp. B TaxID=2502235 RepID=UPI0010F99729|nr:NF038129 family PEP-CTERM protein [Chitinivorax sp. B]
MFARFKQHVLACLAGLVMTTSAWAGPMYHVTIDTQSLSSQTGFIDIGLMGLLDSPLARVVVSKLQGGTQTGVADVMGNVLPTADGWALVNDANSDLLLPWQFGARLSFDVALTGDWLTAASGSGTTFAVKLFDQAFNNVLTTDTAGDLLRLELMAGGNVAPATFTSDQAGNPSVVSLSVQQLPVPTTLLLGLTVLGGMAVTRRYVRR